MTTKLKGFVQVWDPCSIIYQNQIMFIMCIIYIVQYYYYYYYFRYFFLIWKEECSVLCHFHFLFVPEIDQNCGYKYSSQNENKNWVSFCQQTRRQSVFTGFSSSICRTKCITRDFPVLFWKKKKKDFTHEATKEPNFKDSISPISVSNSTSVTLPSLHLFLSCPTHKSDRRWTASQPIGPNHDWCHH